MKTFFILATALTVTAQAASITKFKCKAKVLEKNVSVEFVIKDLESPTRAKLVDTSEGEGDGPFLVHPPSSPVASLNDNWGLMVKKDRLIADGDADGFYTIELVLYKNSEFKKGYVSAKGDENFYAPVSCTRKAL